LLLKKIFCNRHLLSPEHRSASWRITFIGIATIKLWFQFLNL
jgi:hypothetical protein